MRAKKGTGPRPATAAVILARRKWGAIQVGNNNPNWHGGNVEITCKGCKKPFMVIPSRSNSARFCTLRCWNSFQKDNHLTHKALFRYCPSKGKRRVPWIKKQCKQCPSEFELPPGKAKARHFCSHKCQFEWRKEHHSGAHNPNWKGGIANEPYAANWLTQRKKVLKRDGRKCRNPLCFGNGGRITVHHIDYNKMNCGEDNLITVCTSCNSRANFDRPIWTMLYTSLLTIC